MTNRASPKSRWTSGTRNMAPTLDASRTALPPEGAELRLGRPGASFVVPTLVASRTTLPLEGAGLAWGGPARRQLAPALLLVDQPIPY